MVPAGVSVGIGIQAAAQGDGTPSTLYRTVATDQRPAQVFLPTQ